MFDDLDARSGLRTEATDTVLVGLDGRWVELDLTAEHAKELREVVEPYVGAAQPGAAPPALVESKEKMTRTYAAALRAFADERGISYRTQKKAGGGIGGYYYGIELRRAFAAHLAATGQVVE